MSLITFLNPNSIEDASIEGIKLKDGSITSSKIDSSVASKKYVDDTIASAISASDAMVFKGTIGTGGTSESLPSTAIVGDTYKVIALTTIPGASSYTGVEETAKVGDLIVAISAEPKWIVVPSGDEAIDALVQPITWSDLKAKRDAGELTPGMQYRITDYECSTSQKNTKSAGHQFDIIVRADSDNKLNEEASAIQHKGDEYFANSNLSAWKIWYCLDNDINRFSWAIIGELIDTIKPTSGSSSGTYTYNAPISKIIFNNNVYNLEIGVRTCITEFPPIYVTKTDDYTLVIEDEYNFIAREGVYIYTVSKVSKGIIYRMIDEFNNDAPYDFKNIQFYRQWDSSKSLWSIISSDATGIPCYTFSSIGDTSTISFTDMSLNVSNQIYSNVIKEYITSTKQTLNNNCFFGERCHNNSFGNSCYNNSFDNNCYNNSFDNNCYNNSFDNNCYNNSFGNTCCDNSFGNNCYNNSFGNGCYDNSFDELCRYNIFDNDCYNNSFGNTCCDNIFGNNCYNNSFGNDCYNNSFGEKCYNNSFGNSCYNNSFGNNCHNNLFGTLCSNNLFDNNCNYIKFASDSSANTLYNYYQNNHFGDGCQYIVFTGTETASSSTQVQNYKFAQGLQGTSSQYLAIDGVRNRAYETKVAKNSKGEIKIYCEADLIA